MSRMKKVQPEMEAHQEALSPTIRRAAAGDDGAVQAREGQSAVRLPADADPDSGVLLALQGALRHHRDAPGAVLWLDPRSVRARSDLDPQSVRAVALSHPGLSLPAYPLHRHLADPDGHHPVGADQAQSRARRSGAGAHVHLHAADLHLHVRDLPGGPGDLLHLEQSSLGRRSNMSSCAARA